MFGRSHGVKERVAGAAQSAVGYVDPLAKDKKLRRRLSAAIEAGAKARKQVRKQTGMRGTAMRLVNDSVLRDQLVELTAQLDWATRRARKARRHRMRNTVLFMTGMGMVIVAVRSRPGRSRDDAFGASSWDGGQAPRAIDDEIEVGVPVATAYGRWTQFEDFPNFMEGVDEVRRLDESLLHWAATIGGKHTEWNARILERVPNRRIAWESTDARRMRGAVSFEEAGPDRTRIRLHMSYIPESITERVGSAAGVDARRIHGDLERFRELVEARQPV